MVIMRIFAFFYVTAVYAGLALAQTGDVSSFPVSSLMLTPTDTSSPTFSPSAILFVKNRAKTFGDQASPNGTRYVALSDYDLRGKSPEQIIQALSPTVNADNVHKLDIVIDLKDHTTLAVNTHETANIGTALVTASPRSSIDVRSDISVRQLKVIPK
jgi:hypothetical protein